MLFGKTEKKRWHPCLVIAIGALAAAGAVSVIEKGKCMMKGVGCKLRGMMNKGSDECDSDCD